MTDISIVFLSFFAVFLKLSNQQSETGAQNPCAVWVEMFRVFLFLLILLMQCKKIYVKPMSVAFRK